MLSHRTRWSRLLRYRLLIALACGISVLALAPGSMTLASRLSSAWMVAIIAELVLVFRTVGMRNSREVKVWAERVDFKGPWFALFLVTCALASVLASVFVLHVARNEVALSRYIHLILGACTVLITWFAIQSAFAVRYTKMYYGGLRNAGEPGLRFPNDPAPDFYDFLYFATCAGMTFEASDVSVVSKHFRHWLTFHATFSFMFASINLALLVDIAANLI